MSNKQSLKLANNKKFIEGNIFCKTDDDDYQDHDEGLLDSDDDIEQ